MEYLKFGSSKKFIVFLHGWGADKSSFLWLKTYLENYSLLFVDFAGFGETPPPDTPYHVSDYVDELNTLLKQFDIEDLILVGHSFGGRVAIKYAFYYQNEYNNFGIILVDAAGLKPRRPLSYYIKVSRYKKIKKLAEKSKKYEVKLKHFGSADYKAVSGVMKQTFINVVNEDLKDYAKHINCKTAIVWGKKDKDTKLYMAKKFKRLIKHSQLFVFENAGHYSFLDNPQDFLIILDTFVKNL